MQYDPTRRPTTRREEVIRCLTDRWETDCDPDLGYAIDFLQGLICVRCGTTMRVKTISGTPLCPRCENILINQAKDRICKREEQLLRQVQAEREEFERLLRERPSVVYYIDTRMVIAGRRVIKVGRTVALAPRLAAHRSQWPELVLLATEPGGADVEYERHGRFADRVARELFLETPELVEHIASCARSSAADAATGGGMAESASLLSTADGAS